MPYLFAFIHSTNRARFVSHKGIWGVGHTAVLDNFSDSSAAETETNIDPKQELQKTKLQQWCDSSGKVDREFANDTALYHCSVAEQSNYSLI